MFISNLLGCANQYFAAAQNTEAEVLPGFQEILANSLSEKKSDETIYGDGDLIDIPSLKTPNFFVDLPLTLEGFKVSDLEDQSWQSDMQPV